MPRPLAEMPDDVRRAIRGVLTDIDDTLTTRRRADRVARTRRSSACARRAGSSFPSPAARRAGAITSRACGRSTPSSARTARSTCATTRPGASSCVASSMPTRSARNAARAARGHRRARSSRRPGRALASDQHYRETDLAIDYCEDVPPLPRAAVDRIVALMQARGHDGQGELDPRQRLVRRATTSSRRRGRCCARCSASISTPSASASSSSATRRTTRRCSRSSRTRSASRMCGAS